MVYETPVVSHGKVLLDSLRFPQKCIFRWDGLAVPFLPGKFHCGCLRARETRWGNEQINGKDFLFFVIPQNYLEAQF